MTKAGAIRLISILLLALFIEAVCRLGLVSRVMLVPPSVMFIHMWEMIRSGVLTPHFISTMRGVVLAASSAILLGFAIGVIVHSIPRVRRTIEPLLGSYYSIPIFVFYPLFIVIFGLNDIPKMVIGFLAGIVAVIVNTIAGLDRIPPVLMKTAKVFQLSRSEYALQVVLPYIIPYFLTGVKFAVAYGFVGVIASEFLLSSQGLGFVIVHAYDNFDTADMYAVILLILLMTAAVNLWLFSWEKRLMQRRGYT